MDLGGQQTTGLMLLESHTWCFDQSVRTHLHQRSIDRFRKESQRCAAPADEDHTDTLHSQMPVVTEGVAFLKL